MPSPYAQQHMFHALGIRLERHENGHIRATMAVGVHNCQPQGYLCGGASIAMAEILAGMGSLKLVGPGYFPMGIQVSANHLRPAAFGATVQAEGTLIHRGRTLHLWNVDITDTDGALLSSIRVTNCIVQQA